MMYQKNSNFIFLRKVEFSKCFTMAWRILLIFVFILSYMQIDSAQIALAEALPLITTSGSLNAFNSSVGGTSSIQSYKISANNLIEALAISAPQDFEVSLASDDEFATQLSLSPDESGAVPETTIYVRLQPSEAVEYEAVITHSSNGADVVELDVNGSSIPGIEVNGTLSDFTAAAGSYSTEQSYSVTAINLTADLLITAPTGFEISQFSGESFASQLTFSPDASGTLDETTVYVHFYSSITGTLSGSILHRSGDVQSVELAVSGTAASGENYEIEALETESDGDVEELGANYTWAAYNDCAGTNSITNTTNYSLSSTTGLLKNFDTGNNTSVTVTITKNGSPSAAISNGAYSSSGTDAYSTFYNKANMVGVINYASSTGWYVDLTFSGLDSSKTYTFATTANRNDSGYTSRLSQFTISDITSVTNASTTGVTVDSNESVSFCTGYNTLNGYVARWTGIEPGSDGDFAVRINAYPFDSTYYGYGPSVFMLAEEDTISPAITVTSSMTDFTAVTGENSAVQSYTVTGANLTEDITVASSNPTNFVVSDAETGTYGTSTTLDAAGGTVYVLFNSSTAGTFEGTLTHTSGTTSETLDVSGTAITYYTLTTNATNGTITLSPTGGSYASGTVVTVTAAAASGYMFTGWSGDLSGTTNPTTITMSGNKSVTAGFVAGTCTTINLEASEDNYLSANDVTYNNGSNTIIHVDATTGTSRRTALLKWNLDDIPDDAIVSSASLSLYVTDASSLVFYMYNMRQSWVEGTSSQAASTTSSNWNTYNGTTSWGTVGAASTSTDRYDTNLWDATTTSYSLTGSKTISLNDDGIDVIQGWIDSPSTNYGVTLQNYSGTTSNAVYFASSENTSYAGPTLNVSYCVLTGPKITVTGSLDAFSTTPGNPSVSQTYTISGSNLEGDIDISAPEHFELSTNNEIFYQDILLEQTDGEVETTTIYVRLNDGNTEGTFSGNITHISDGASEVDLAVSGTIASVYTLTVTNDSNGSVTLSPTGGSYSSGTTVTLTPVPNTNYVFSGWSGANNADIVNTSGVYTIVMNGDKSIMANFATSTCSTVHLEAVDDTYMSSYNTTNNYGASTTLKATNNNSGNQRGSLFKWNVSSIPSNAIVSSASISLYISTSSSQTYNLYNMRRTWVEGTGTGSVSNDGATWLTYDGITADTWGTSGAANTTSDRYDTNLWGAGTSSFSSQGSKTVNLNSSGVTVVQGWIVNSASNFGVTLQNYSSTSGSDDLQFASAENTSNTGATLNITYCIASTLPAINTSSSLSEFTSNVGVYSAEQSYTVSGDNLTEGITIDPPNNFEISLTSGGGFTTDPIVLSLSGSSVSDTNIYIRFISSEAGTYSGNITHVSSGVTQVNIPVSGTASNGSPVIALIQPADDATNVNRSAPLQVLVTDPDADNTDVQFYGRPVGGGTGEDFMIVTLPDVQNESQYAPSMFTSQTNWIVNNKDAKNIVFVTSLGDMVNSSSSTTQYEAADAAVDILDAGNVWYTMATGNHDIAYGTTYYANYFGVSRYQDYLYEDGYWFAGSYDDYNTYSLFSAGGMDFILINLQYSPTTAILTWADGILTNYSNRRAIVEQHNILNVDNSWNSSTSYETLRKHDNLFMMICGHMHSSGDGAAYVAGTTTSGKTIHVVLADYQDMNYGNGYLRLFRFSPANDMIYMTTYSPYALTSITSTSNYDQADLAYDMESSIDFELLGTVSGVTSGTTASFTWDGLANTTEYEWYAVASDATTSTTSDTWSFTTGTTVTNNPPVITEGDATSVTMSEDGSPNGFGLTLNATDADGNILYWSISTIASHGIAQVSSGIGYAQIIYYAPFYNYYGSDSFVVLVSDGTDIDTITVNVTIEAVDDTPVADAQSVSTNEDTPKEITLTGSDVEGSTLTYDVSDYPDHGSVVLVSMPNVCTYTPNADYYGDDSFTFTVKDDVNTSVAATVSITINPINDAPVVSDILNQTIDEGASFTTIALDDYVSDVDNTDAQITWSSSGNVELNVHITNRIVTIGIPDVDWNGAETITFTATDPDSLFSSNAATFTVNAVNDAPVITETDPYNATTPKNQGLSLTLHATDVDSATLNWGITTDPINGDAEVTDGVVTFTPETDFVGQDSFVVQVSDSELTDTITINVTVTDTTTTQSISLVEGWNLVSFYLEPASTVIADVLSPIDGKYSLVYAWDGSVAPASAWSLYDPAHTYASQLTTLDNTMGFWINMTEDATLVIEGTAPTSTNITFSTVAGGWNLVAYPDETAGNLPDILTTNGVDVEGYESIYAYHASDTSDVWKMYDRTGASYANDLNSLESGWGYWINVNEDATWTVP